MKGGDGNLSTVELTIEGELAVVRLKRSHGNAINDELAADLVAACREVEQCR